MALTEPGVEMLDKLLQLEVGSVVVSECDIHRVVPGEALTSARVSSNCSAGGGRTAVMLATVGTAVVRKRALPGILFLCILRPLLLCVLIVQLLYEPTPTNRFLYSHHLADGVGCLLAD